MKKQVKFFVALVLILTTATVVTAMPAATQMYVTNANEGYIGIEATSRVHDPGRHIERWFRPSAPGTITNIPIRLIHHTGNQTWNTANTNLKLIRHL